MNPCSLLTELTRAGITLTARGDRLHVEALPGTLTQDLRQRLIDHKVELLTWLSGRAEPRDLRAHLLALAADELLSADPVHGLEDADVAACAGLDDPTLRAYLRMLDRDGGMARGIVPEGWESVAHCDACGPIHWYATERLKACGWCKHRRALRAIPRPRCAAATASTIKPTR